MSVIVGGLNSAEAAHRLAKDGANLLPARPGVPLWRRIAAQLRDPLVLVLLAAALLTMAIGDWADAAVIMLVVVVNTTVGVVQEVKADRAISALSDLTAPEARVVRDGAQRLIPSADLVVGDLLVLAEGDIVPADATVVEAAALLVDESALTGESVPVDKAADAPNPGGAVSAGTVVVRGRGRAVVTATGAASAAGRIAALMTTAPALTPLQRRLVGLGRVLAGVAVVLCALVGLLGLLRGQPLPDGENGDLVANVRPGPAVPVSETVRLLAEAIPRRHTNRRPFESTAVPPEVLADLRAAAAVEGGDLVVADPALRDAVLGVVRAAEHVHRRDPDYYGELADWTADSRPRRDGLPPETFGPWSALEVVPLRDFGLITPVARRDTTEYESEPTIALLYSHGDDREHWLRTGQALERTLLTASVRGLASTLMTQPMEIPRLRDLLTISAKGAVAQTVLRFGYGPPSPPSPRRTLSSVLLNDRELLEVR